MYLCVLGEQRYEIAFLIARRSPRVHGDQLIRKDSSPEGRSYQGSVSSLSFLVPQCLFLLVFFLVSVLREARDPAEWNQRT